MIGVVVVERIDFLAEDSISKIRAAWNDAKGKMFVSYSGGRDSDVLKHLIERSGVPAEIIFFDTGIELDAIYDHIKSQDDIKWLKPRKPFGQIIKQYGKPFRSKYKSEYLKTYDGSHKNPFRLVRNNEFIKGTIHGIELNGEIYDTGKVAKSRALAKRDFHILHPDRINEYKIANKCCSYLKKDPSKHYIQENDVNGYYMGVMKAEGGARAVTYTSCRSVKKIGKKVILQSMPLFDWTKQDIQDYIEKHQIPISKAYTEYNLKRTGCFCCPFAQEMDVNLEALYKHEPNKYKASLKWLGDVYMDMGVNLPFDEEYTKAKALRDEINEKRRKEMLEHFGRE